MRFPKRTLMIAILGVLLVFAALVIIFFDKFFPLSPVTMLKIMSDRADLEVKNILYWEVGGDGNKWEIRAKKASYQKRQNKAYFDQIEVKLFLPDSKVILLAADRGELDTATRDMKISGNVGVTSVSGERFATDYLQYSAQDQRLHTDATVLMETPRMRIRGVGMSLSLRNRDIVLLSSVRARIR